MTEQGALDKQSLLLAKVADGDEVAFRELFNATYGRIYAVALALTKSTTLSEEIVQDVFVKLWMNRTSLTQVVKFDNYVFTIARNHIYNVLRKKTAEPVFVEHLEQYLLCSQALPELELDHKETHELIQRALESLPEQQRAVFTLSRIDGLDHSQIAAQLDISKLTVKSHMNRALKSIRLFLNKHSDGELMFFLFVLTISSLKK